MNKRSPFPGMDPWLELRWGDVHAALCIGIRAALQPDLPEGLQAIAQEEILLEDDDEGDTDDEFANAPLKRPARYRPDAAVLQIASGADDSGDGGTAVAATIEPIEFRDVSAPMTRRWVEVIDTRTRNRVVTAIEILSPGNKRAGKLNDDYIEKIYDYVAAGVNVVEIDLLRSPRVHLCVKTDQIPPIRRTAYYTVIGRATKRGFWSAYPMKLRLSLPTIPIPLRKADPDVMLALQPVIDRIYLEGGHYHTDYATPLPRPLEGEEAEWAVELIKVSRGSPS